MEELALAHILNAEGEKLQYFLGTLQGTEKPVGVTICDILAANESVRKTIRDIAKAEMILQFKMESAIELDGDESELCRKSVKGKVVWNDNDDVLGLRPNSVDIVLYRNGTEYRTLTVNVKGDGIFIFECLPIWGSNGERYVYTVDEPNVPSGYLKSVKEYIITNNILR